MQVFILAFALSGLVRGPSQETNERRLESSNEIRNYSLSQCSEHQAQGSQCDFGSGEASSRHRVSEGHRDRHTAGEKQRPEKEIGKYEDREVFMETVGLIPTQKSA